jgi:hypothetical protein
VNVTVRVYEPAGVPVLFPLEGGFTFTLSEVIPHPTITVARQARRSAVAKHAPIGFCIQTTVNMLITRQSRPDTRYRGTVDTGACGLKSGTFLTGTNDCLVVLALIAIGSGDVPVRIGIALEAVQVAPTGAPLHVTLTGPAKPPVGVSTKWNTVDSPVETVAELEVPGTVSTEKSA